MAQHRTLTHPFQSSFRSLTPLLPGILLCAAVSCAAILAERFQVRLAGHAWLGDLVLAILIGTLLRSLVSLPAVASAGIKFSAKTLLEIAVALLGASLSLAILKGAGGLLIGGIAVIVALSLIFSYAAGRMLGLPPKLATLIACGNFHLRQFGDRGGSARHWRQARRCRRIDCFYSRSRCRRRSADAVSAAASRS